MEIYPSLANGCTISANKHQVYAPQTHFAGAVTPFSFDYSICRTYSSPACLRNSMPSNPSSRSPPLSADLTCLTAACPDHGTSTVTGYLVSTYIHTLLYLMYFILGNVSSTAALVRASAYQRTLGYYSCQPHGNQDDAPLSSRLLLVFFFILAYSRVFSLILACHHTLA